MNDAIKILIIDDSEDDRLLYRRALHKSPHMVYTISEASEGATGLKHIDEEQPTCVLLDYSLPGHNGIEVLKQIRSQHPFIPVVMLTGQGNENIAVAAMQQGAQNYISKSNITPETLEHVIRMAIEHCSMQKRIHEQRTSLEVFTRALAHDLNEPVRTIRSFIDMIDQFDAPPEKTKTYFKHIRNATDRMRMLIDTVFLYTRLENPEEMPREICNMATVLKEAEDNLHQLIHEHAAIVTHASLPDVHISRTQLMQVLQNLVSNAINHSEQPVTVHVGASAQDDHWVFRVTDNGPGIDEAYFQKIFEPFKRMTHHEEQGAGLGLAICRKIVEAHGGKIWCESKPGAGATFLFTLPRTLPVPEGIYPAQEPEAVEPTPIKSAQPVRRPLANILLVDDSKAFIEITQFELIERARLQCNFFVARNGEEALALMRDGAKSGPIDLVLLDINMPEMDGFEVLERMREKEELRQVSVVMCTGSTYDQDISRAKTLGANGYVTKPIEFDKLKSVIDETTNVQFIQEGSSYALRRVA